MDNPNDIVNNDYDQDLDQFIDDNNELDLIPPMTKVESSKTDAELQALLGSVNADTGNKAKKEKEEEKNDGKED